MFTIDNHKLQNPWTHPTSNVVRCRRMHSLHMLCPANEARHPKVKSAPSSHALTSVDHGLQHHISNRLASSLQTLRIAARSWRVRSLSSCRPCEWGHFLVFSWWCSRGKIRMIAPNDCINVSCWTRGLERLEVSLDLCLFSLTFV